MEKDYDPAELGRKLAAMKLAQEQRVQPQEANIKSPRFRKWYGERHGIIFDADGNITGKER